MKKNSFIIFPFLLIILVFNLKIHQSYIIQSYILPDLNSNSVNYKEKVIDIDYRFPNISVTSMNISDLVARYYINDRDYDKAIELINFSKYDPLGFGESLKSQIYLSQNNIDSFIVSSKRALDKLPLNTGHLLYQMKALSIIGDYEQMRNTYLKIKNRSRFYNNSYFYLVTAYSFRDYLGNKLIQDAKEILYDYKDSDYQDLKTICYYIIYGENNYKNFIKNFEKGSLEFKNKDYDEASLSFKKSIDLFPLNFESYENLIISNFNGSNYDEVIDSYKLLNDSINIKKGKIEFIVSEAYFKIGENEKGCELLNKSIYFGYVSKSVFKDKNCQ